ncbi:non-specific lipid-transfer protein 1-like [Panicum miliaceum]|uniref:Non-specific lipid-transfer protein n=1 Tax=Panicum miliaceum TaxID=4540 RepID=A0A3L6RWX4_PANMI|nr:non-specific lipid-transfer protein 1-like [Panicum miliaceum]
MTKTTISALAVVALLAAVAFHQQPARAADIACPAVLQDMTPCLPFLQGGDGRPSGACCAGVRSLYASADTTAERRATCECLKTAYRQVQAQLSAAQALPDDCGLSLPYVITPDIDCNT